MEESKTETDTKDITLDKHNNQNIYHGWDPQQTQQPPYYEHWTTATPSYNPQYQHNASATPSGDNNWNSNYWGQWNGNYDQWQQGYSNGVNTAASRVDSNGSFPYYVGGGYNGMNYYGNVSTPAVQGGYYAQNWNAGQQWNGFVQNGEGVVKVEDMEIDNESEVGKNDIQIVIQKTGDLLPTSVTDQGVESRYSWGAKVKKNEEKRIGKKRSTTWSEATKGIECVDEIKDENEPPKKKAKGISMDEWPKSLRNYVERAFNQYTEEVAKSRVESKLRNIISESIKSGTIWTINWDTEPLPRVIDEPHLIQYQKSRFTLGLPENIHNFESEKTFENKHNPYFSSFVPLSDTKKIAQRQQRFQHDTNEEVVVEPQQHNPTYFNYVQRQIKLQVKGLTEEDWEDMAVVGTCQKLEKKYLRLTAAPEPSNVRPESVLKSALEMVKDRWKQTQEWEWVCEQLKSIRQDLTVQQIKNEFTAHVYEIHARLCLENNHIGEYNQCQSQLFTLYQMKIPGSEMEFVAYRILYSLYEDNPLSQNRVLAELTSEMKKNEAVKHALTVRQAVAEKNYFKYFKLYKEAPNLGRYLMKTIFDKLRIEALIRYTKVFRPTIPVSHIQNFLAFKSEEHCITFLTNHYCVINLQDSELDCKHSHIGLKRWVKEEEEKHRLGTDTVTT